VSVKQSAGDAVDLDADSGLPPPAVLPLSGGGELAVPLSVMTLACCDDKLEILRQGAAGLHQQQLQTKCRIAVAIVITSSLTFYFAADNGQNQKGVP
jgi:hypothetical protein